MAVHYSKEVLTKENKYFIYIGEDCTGVFAKKILYNLQVFLNKKWLLQRKKHWLEKACYIYEDELIQGDKK